MDKKTFEAIAFRALFDANNSIRIKEGRQPINFNPHDKYLGWLSHKEFKGNMTIYIDGLYESLRNYLED